MAFLKQAKTEDEIKKLTVAGVKKAYNELSVDYNKLVNLDVRVDLDRMKYVPEDEFDAKTEELRDAIQKQCSEAGQ